MARVWDFVGLLARFNWGLLKQDMAGRPGVIRIGMIWYHRVDDYFIVFLVVEIETWHTKREENKLYKECNQIMTGHLSFQKVFVIH